MPYDLLIKFYRKAFLYKMPYDFIIKFYRKAFLYKMPYDILNLVTVRLF